jgi:hypothetical protein
LDGWLLAIDVAYLQTLVLWPFEDLVTMETVESVGRVLTGWVDGGWNELSVRNGSRTNVIIEEDCGASGMKVLEPSKVVNPAVDYYPLKEV